MSDHSAMYEISVSIPHDPRPGNDDNGCDGVTNTGVTGTIVPDVNVTDTDMMITATNNDVNGCNGHGCEGKRERERV